jgi:hypothetical protein
MSPNRRWLRFSIRTLLLAVTIFCVWLGWQVSIVREREKLLQLVLRNGADFMRGNGIQWSLHKARERGWIHVPRSASQPFRYSGDPLPWPREALGDRTITVIGVPSDLADDKTIQRLRDNFSESILCLIPRRAQTRSAGAAPPPQQSP